MPRSKKQQRRLGFEHLEAKTSLTSLAPWVSGDATVEVAGQARASRFLAYVETLSPVSIERVSPDAEVAQATDHWLQTESPN